MCTSVRNDRLGSLPTRDRKLSREHGPATSATSHRRRRRIVRSRLELAVAQTSAGGGWFFGVPTNQLDAHFGLSADHAKWRSFAL